MKGESCTERCRDLAFPSPRLNTKANSGRFFGRFIGICPVHLICQAFELQDHCLPTTAKHTPIKFFSNIVRSSHPPASAPWPENPSFLVVKSHGFLRPRVGDFPGCHVELSKGQFIIYYPDYYPIVNMIVPMMSILSN